MIHFFTMSESVACVLIVDDRVLLIQRRDIPVWTLPGGGIDVGEMPEGAVVRETEEETGLRVGIVRKVAEYTPINRLARVTHLFEVCILSGELATSSETRAIQFFPLEALPYHLPPPYADWINDALSYTPGVIKKKLTTLTYKRLLLTLLKHPILVLRFLLTRLGLHFNTFS